MFIPPLINIQDKYEYLKSDKINNIFNKKQDDEIIINDNSFIVLKEIIFKFINHKESQNVDNISDFFEKTLNYYQNFINYIENIFFVNGSKFHKEQQINIIKNFILSIRYLIKINCLNINKNIIIDKIKIILNSLLAQVTDNESIMYNYENMYYINLFDEIFFYLSILFNYNEIKDIFKYIINLFLPYFAFGFYLRNLISKNNFYSLYNDIYKDKININGFFSYIINHEQLMLDSFHYLLQKLSIIKLITDYDNKNDDKIFNNFNELSIEKLLYELDMEKFYKLLMNDNELKISFIHIFEILPKTFNDNDKFYKEYAISFDYKKILESLIFNIKKNKYEKYIVKNKLLIQLIPLKFGFIQLDKNVFDLIEKNNEKKCMYCSEKSIYFNICLICGEKLCHNRANNCFKGFDHSRECGGIYGYYIDMDNMKLFIYNCLNGTVKESSSIYSNEVGAGPNNRKIGNEFNLNKEKLQTILKNYICNEN